MTMSERPSRLPVLPSKVDQVFEYVKTEILEGRYAPGERLSMDALARNLGVSRIPIREAMNRLESQGLVVQQQHVGPIVAPVSFQQLQGVYLARQAMESLTTRLAADRITPEQLDELEKCQVQMDTLLVNDEIGELSALNSTFHQIIADAAGYQVLRDITDHLLLSVRRYRAVAPMNRGNWRRVVSEHAAIIEALRRGDPEAAERAAVDHTTSQANGEARLQPGLVSPGLSGEPE